MEEALKSWLRKAEKRCQHSTIRDYNSSVYFHLIPNFGKFTLDEFQLSNVYDWLETVNISNKRVNNVLGPLRQALQEAFYDGHIDANPMDRFRYRSPETREPQPFNQDEISRRLTQLEGQEKNLIQFAFWSGLRTSELIALRWEDIDLDNNRFYVRIAIVLNREKTTKTTSGVRTVELQPEARNAIEDQHLYSAGKLRVFNDPTTELQWKGDHIIRKRIWIPSLKAANVQYRTPYQTRHTFASMLLSSGKNPLWVAQQMGHKD